jgi:hypothetical protein
MTVHLAVRVGAAGVKATPTAGARQRKRISPTDVVDSSWWLSGQTNDVNGLRQNNDETQEPAM